MATYLESGGIVVVEAEHYAGSAASATGGRTWALVSDGAAVDPDAGGGALQATGDGDWGNSFDEAELSYTVQIATAGTYYFLVRHRGADALGRLNVRIDGVAQSPGASTFGIYPAHIGATGYGTWTSRWGSGGGTQVSFVLAAGTYTVRIQPVRGTSTIDRWLLTTDSGATYSTTGPAESATAGGGPTYTLTAETGAYVLTGQPATLTVSRKLTADAGSYALTGNDATLTVGRRLTAETGTYVLTGNAADLVYTPIGGPDYTLTAAAGSYALTGQPATLTVARRLTAETGTYALTGQAAALTVGRRLTAETGSYALTGQPATLTVARRLEAATGAYVLTGNAAALTYSGAALTTPDAVALSLGAGPSVTPSLGAAPAITPTLD